MTFGGGLQRGKGWEKGDRKQLVRVHSCFRGPRIRLFEWLELGDTLV